MSEVLGAPKPKPKRSQQTRANSAAGRSTKTATSHQADPLKSSSQIVGAITGLADGVLSGWVMDIKSPDVLLSVEVYYDDVFGHVVRADSWLEDLSEDSLGHAPEQVQWHAFVVPLDRQWLASCSKVTVRVANQGPWLGQGIRLGKSHVGQLPDRRAGRLFHAGGLKVVGWAWGGTEDQSFKSVVALEGEGASARELVRVSANQSLSLLASEPAQGHGFVMDLPWFLADGKRHHLQLVTESGEPLDGSPIDVCITANTLTGLIQDAAGQTNEKLKALLPVISAYERQYPVSVGFVHYLAWCDLYQAAPKPIKSTLRCAVVVITAAGEDELADLSVKSVFAQRHPEGQVECFKVLPQALLKGLRAVADLADVVVPVWAGDQLAKHALDVIAASADQALAKDEQCWGYADDDVVQAMGELNEGQDHVHRLRTDPWLKPDWDETLFYGLDYVSKGVFLSSSLVKHALSSYSDVLHELSGQWGYESIAHLIDHPTDAQPPSSVWHAFLSVVVADTAIKRSPVHLRQVLYHLRTRTVEDASARVQALDWLAKTRVSGARVELENSFMRVVWPMPQKPARVTVIVPTRNCHELLQVVMQGLLHHTHYPALELIVVDNDSDCAQTLAYFDELRQTGVNVLSYPKPFNYSAINNVAARQANGELLLFLNNDVEIKDPRWLSEMVVQFERPDVGVVGKKLLWPNGLVQHGGVVVGVNGLAAHAFNDCWADDPGYMGLNRLDREQSAVTAACLMIRREDFFAVGGFDEINLPVTFNDVDLCLKVRERGKRVVITTRFPIIHHESASRGKEDTPPKKARAKHERQSFMQRWIANGTVYTDPYYHPGLNHDFLLGPYGGLGKLHR